MRSCGKGQQSAERDGRERGDRPDLDERRLARDASRAPARLRPRRMRVQAMRRLGELQGEALAEEQEAIDEPGAQLDVVVDEQQPVVAIGRMGGEQPVQVLELPSPAGRARVQLDVMARAQELGANRLRASARGPGARRSAPAPVAGAESDVRRAPDAGALSSPAPMRRPARPPRRAAGRRVLRPCRSCPRESRRSPSRCSVLGDASPRAGPPAGARRCARPSSIPQGSVAAGRARCIRPA